MTASGDWQKNLQEFNRLGAISGSRALFFLYGVFRVCFDGDLNGRSGLESNLLPLFIDQSIFNANFPIQLLCILYGDFSLLRRFRVHGLDDLLNCSGQSRTWFFALPL